MIDRRSRISLLVLSLGVLAHVTLAQPSNAFNTSFEQPESGQAEEGSPTGVRRALILVGLPGDAEHQKLFANITQSWTTWLTDKLQFDEEHVIVLGSQSDQPNRQGTRAQLAQWADRLVEQSRPQDGVWVFFVGHANYDEKHAYFHLPGPDVHERDVAEMFDGLECGEQVFWLTNTCSGWYLKSLSKPGRIVVTASAAEREFNETEFPNALAKVTERPIESLDRDNDGKASIAELFTTTVDQVEALFKADNRAPTEHAQLDDNGDGAATEAGELRGLEPPSDDADSPSPVARRVKLPDGALAAKTFLRPQPSLPEN